MVLSKNKKKIVQKTWKHDLFEIFILEYIFFIGSEVDNR